MNSLINIAIFSQGTAPKSGNVGNKDIKQGNRSSIQREGGQSNWNIVLSDIHYYFIANIVITVKSSYNRGNSHEPL